MNDKMPVLARSTSGVDVNRSECPVHVSEGSLFRKVVSTVGETGDEKMLMHALTYPL